MSGRPLRVVHCPVNMGSIGWTNVEFLRKKGVDARLVLFKPRRLRPYEIDVNLDVPDNFVRRQIVQFRALADLLPTTDVFHFYFGLTLVPKSLQFPILDMYGKKSVFHYLGSDIRGKTPKELSYGKRASAPRSSAPTTRSAGCRRRTSCRTGSTFRSTSRPRPRGTTRSASSTHPPRAKRRGRSGS